MPTAPQPFFDYTIAQLAASCAACPAQPGHGCMTSEGQPLSHFHAPRLNAIDAHGICTFPHCKCRTEDLCPEVSLAAHQRS